MSRQYQLTSVERIISKVYRDLGVEEVPEIEAVEWCGEALEAINAPAIYKEEVIFLIVKNFETSLPLGLHQIIQVARNNGSVIVDSCEKIEEEVSTEESCNCPNPLTLDMIASNWIGSAPYKETFQPIRLSNNTFFGSVVSEETQCPYDSDSPEYSIVGEKLKFSFEEGQVALAYKKQILDEETGYPLVPDSYSFVTAITHYITMKIMARFWYQGRQGDYRNMYIKAEQDWQFYCKQASNESFMLYGIDEHQNFMEEQIKMLPNHQSYYSFFGTLGKQQSSKWKSDGRRR